MESVGKWAREISRLTKLSSGQEKTSTIQEQQFWSSYLASLQALEQQMEEEGVALSLEVLKKRGKFHATTNFEGEKINLKGLGQRVAKISRFMNDLPIESLLTCDSLQ